MKIFDAIKASGYSKMEYLLVNYFWLNTISAILGHVTGIGWFMGLLLPIIIYSCLFSNKSYKRNDSILDMFWWFIFVWNVISLLVIQYPHSGIMAIRCLTSQLAYMMVYWIVRKNPKVNISAIITSAYWPFVIACILGIAFYINPPSWYVNANVVSDTDNITTFEELNALKFRSVFASAYNIAYFGAILIIFEFFVLIRKNVENKRTHYAISFLAIVSVFLTAMRAPVAATLLGFVISLIYANLYGGFKNIKSLSIVLGIISAVLIIIINQMDSLTYDFFFMKYNSVFDSESGYIQERLLHNQGQSTFSLFGDGVGRYNMYADKYPPNFSKRDGEYLKLLLEQGYLGAFFNILFWGSALLKSIFNFKDLKFEVCILIMLSVCMIGANPLSTVDKYPFIFWMAVGQIANYRKYGKNKIVNSNSNV